ncbi:MAG: hypothetical protein ACRD0K_08525 [Egibacteraceae bacterium]
MNPLTDNEVNRLVDDWFQKLDVHAPVEDLLAMLAKDGLEMRLPEGTLRTEDEFKRWYKNKIIRRYFDEVHEVNQVSITPAGDRANVEVVVNWHRRTWDPPKARSAWLAFDASQTWIVQRSPTSGQPVIVTYIADVLKPRDGAAQYEGCTA